MLITSSFNTSSGALEPDSNYGAVDVRTWPPRGRRPRSRPGTFRASSGARRPPPHFSYAQLISRITGTVQSYTSLAGKVATGGLVSPADAVKGLLAPTFVTPALATPATVIGTTTAPSRARRRRRGRVLAHLPLADTPRPDGAPSPTFNANDSNAAKNTTATFARAGAYTFQVTATDGAGYSATSRVSVTVGRTLTARSR